MTKDSEKKITDYIQKVVSLSEGEVSQFIASFIETKVKKRQFIVQPNFTTKSRNYVVQGAFRAYVVADGGQDHTISFAIDDWWITDYNSYIYQKPATMFIIALEDSIILQIDYDKEQELKMTNHKFESFFRIMAEKGLAFHQRKIIANLTQTAEERYENFIKSYPAIVQRVPQYALASFLGMSTEFLSRIRNKKVKRKS